MLPAVSEKQWKIPSCRKGRLRSMSRLWGGSQSLDIGAALSLAASHGHLATVQYLAGERAATALNLNGAAALMAAASQGHVEIARYLGGGAGVIFAGSATTDFTRRSAMRSRNAKQTRSRKPQSPPLSPGPTSPPLPRARPPVPLPTLPPPRPHPAPHRRCCRPRRSRTSSSA